MRPRLYLAALFVFVLILLAVPACLHAEDWLPIPPEDLAMTSNPKDPGAHAMILYREVELDDQHSTLTEYFRIKIFDESGRGYADVETPSYNPSDERVIDVKGRTIHPDGSIVPFEGKVFQNAYAKKRSFGLSVSAFTLPSVTPGSIIEYRFKVVWDPDGWYSDSWFVGANLFQRKAHFTFIPWQEGDAKIYWQNYLINQKPKEVVAGANAGTGASLHKMVMDVENIAGVEEEPFMPPISEMLPRIEFYYHDGNLPPPDEYWNDAMKQWSGVMESFMNRKGAMENRVAAIVKNQDSPDVKLHKIYDYVRSLRNLTYEEGLTVKEAKKLQANNNVEDVAKRGYGGEGQLNMLFVALARAAGIDAYIVAVGGRDERIFHKEILTQKQLDFLVAMVRNNGKDQYFDPGLPVCPFGVLPWQYTAVTGLRLDKKAPAFITTPAPEPENASISRKAELTLQADGSLDGTVTVTYVGQDAFFARYQVRKEDEAGKKKAMEERLAKWIEHRGEFSMENANDWNSSTLPLIVTYKIHIPGFASVGSRMLFSPMVFSGVSRNPFPQSERRFPIIFEYTYSEGDDITIALPAGFEVEASPAPKALNNAMANYTSSYTRDNGKLHVERKFRLNGIRVDQKYYATVRGYFGRIQDSDNEKAVLKKN